MKNKVLALAATTMLAISAAQAAPSNWQSGDILLGFRAFGDPGTAKNVVIDIGSAANLGSLNVALGTDLGATFGANWYTRTDIYWGAFGADNSRNIWASIASGSTPWVSLGNGNSTPKSNLFAAGSRYNSDISFSNYGSVAVLEDASDATQLWQSYLENNFAFTGSLNNGTIEATTPNALDIIAVGTTRNTSGTVAATISVDSSGNVTAVPEPSTYALIGTGALLFLVTYRRKTA
jgi:hypothetical protein